MTHPHHITDAAAAHTFMFGGRSRFTLVSKKTGTRYTYRVTKLKDSDNIYFIGVLTDGDNTGEYTYIGFIATGGTHSRVKPGRRGNPSHPAYKGIKWLVEQIENSNPLGMPDAVEFWHEGRCARCARPLTDPASIELGLGPECAGKV